MATEQSIDAKLTENKHRLEAAGLTPEQAELFLKLGLTPEQIIWVLIGVQTGFKHNENVWEVNAIPGSPVCVTLAHGAFVPLQYLEKNWVAMHGTPSAIYPDNVNLFELDANLKYIGQLKSPDQPNFMCLVFEIKGLEAQ